MGPKGGILGQLPKFIKDILVDSCVLGSGSHNLKYSDETVSTLDCGGSDSFPNFWISTFKNIFSCLDICWKSRPPP